MLISGGDPGEVAAELTAVQAREPLRETTTELLMWARSAAGQQADALEAFSATQRLLRDELGADPGPALAAMHERVLRADPTLRARTAVVASPVARDRTLTWSGLDSFVGRDRDMREVTVLLASHRLVTLTGPGGVGKTRLATQVPHQQFTCWASALVRRAGPATRERPGTCRAIAAAVGLQVSAGTNALLEPSLRTWPSAPCSCWTTSSICPRPRRMW